jgi:hypothetical protein
MRGIINRRIRVQTILSIKQDPISKIIKNQKRLAEISRGKMSV